MAPLDRNSRPSGVQCGFGRYGEGRARRIACAAAVGRGVPAGEGVAGPHHGASAEDGYRRAEDIRAVGVNRDTAAGAAVAVVGYGVGGKGRFPVFY